MLDDYSYLHTTLFTICCTVVISCAVTACNELIRISHVLHELLSVANSNHEVSCLLLQRHVGFVEEWRRGQSEVVCLFSKETDQVIVANKGLD